jgi:transcriptional regulator with XRE-family HTH domain
MGSARTTSVHRQLGELLRRRRERSNPADFGFAKASRRRRPGLRREQVADLAGFSVDWYVRLEQGRESLPSKATVGALPKALRLSSTERAHVYARICHRCRCDLLCWNGAAVKLFLDFSKVAVAKRNTAAPVVQLA